MGVAPIIVVYAFRGAAAGVEPVDELTVEKTATPAR